jgi:type I restriction enzyme, R subunit
MASPADRDSIALVAATSLKVRCRDRVSPEQSDECVKSDHEIFRKDNTGNPKYKALAERLEDLKNRHQQGLLVSIDFLKELLELAKDVVRLEREIPVEEEINRGKAALTELFEQAKSVDTPIMVKRVVDDIDEIVRAVRFDGWQNTHAGEREVKIALRKTLFKYKLHQDTELFERAYGYIREYY